MKKFLFLILGLIFSSSLSFAKDDSMTTTCTRVVDGDTIVISGGDKVKLIGVDAPELHASAKPYKKSEHTGQDIKTIHALGKKASDFTKGFLIDQDIRLEFDPNNAYINHRDKYGRLLSYIYIKIADKDEKNILGMFPSPYQIELKDDGWYLFFNAFIIKAGAAYAYTKLPFEYMDEFRKYEKEARESRRGLWVDKDF